MSLAATGYSVPSGSTISTHSTISQMARPYAPAFIVSAPPTVPGIPPSSSAPERADRAHRTANLGSITPASATAVHPEQVAAPPQRPHFPVRGALRREDLLDLPHRAGEDQPFGRPTDSDGGELPHLGAERLLDPFHPPSRLAPPLPALNGIQHLLPVSRHLRPPWSEICRPIAVGAEPPPPLPRPSLRKRSPCVRGPVSHRRAARPRPPGSALLPRGTPRKRRAGPRHGTRRRPPGTGHVSGSTE